MAKVNYNVEECRSILRDDFRTISPAAEEELIELTSMFNLGVYPAKSMIIQPNINNTKIYYIIKGLVRRYYILDGKEINADFNEENKLFSCTYSLFTGKPNIDYYDALEDTVCLFADFKDLEQLFSKYHSLERLARRIVEKYYALFLIENYNKLFLTSEERFNIFMQERASLINRVSLKKIASYLSITPETLSRLRAKR